MALNQEEKKKRRGFKENATVSRGTGNVGGRGQKYVRQRSAGTQTKQKTKKGKATKGIPVKKSTKGNKKTKTKEIKKEETTDEESEDETSSSSAENMYKESTNDASASSGSETERRKKKKKKKSMDPLVKAMAKLDTRKTPALRKFDLSKGKSLEEYLGKFEEYCKNTVKGGKDYWIEELENYLTGSILDTYKILRNQEDKYKKFKKRLLEWYDDNRKVIKQQLKENFKSSWYSNEGISLYLYSTQLQNLFSLAYPKADPTYNKKLIRKLIEGIPQKVKTNISTYIFNKEMAGEKVKYSDIQQCIKIQEKSENMFERRNEEKEDAVVKEILVQPILKVSENQYNDGRQINQPNRDRFNRFDKEGKYFNSNRQQSEDQNRRGGGVRRYNRPSQKGRNEEEYCEYCRNRGHSEESCRWKWNLCLTCGDPNHKCEKCPKAYWNRNKFQSVEGARNEANHGENGNPVTNDLNQKALNKGGKVWSMTMFSPQ